MMEQQRKVMKRSGIDSQVIRAHQNRVYKELYQIVKQIIAREGPNTYEGNMYQLPYTGEGATGLGKPLKSILHCEEDIPVFAASITPAGVAAAAEVCDGFFPIWMDPEKFSVFQPAIDKP